MPSRSLDKVNRPFPKEVERSKTSKGQRIDGKERGRDEGKRVEVGVKEGQRKGE